MTTLQGPHRLPRSGQEPSSLTVLLHGLGADGTDLLGLADHLGAEFPDMAFHAPNAPDPYDQAPSGYQWLARGEQDPQRRLQSFQRIKGLLTTYLADLLRLYSLDGSRCFLLGFSQGTMVSLFTALRLDQPLAGVVGFSGVVPPVGDLRTELRSCPPVLLVGGTEDALIAQERVRESARLLTTLAVPHECHLLSGLGHAIDIRGLRLAARFISTILDRGQEQ